ncbi:MAG: enoyl-CoA hydratase/isomerase family protein, partial [Ilumatobacteraceae bacterium]
MKVEPDPVIARARDEVRYEVVDHVATITLDAPERMNTISGPMLDAISRHLLEADHDPDVRCIVLTGAGRAFCAGL